MGGDLKRISSRVAIRVSADMMPRGHLGPRRGEGKHRIGCWAWEASVATGSCPFAGDTPGKVERAPAAASCNPCGNRTRATGASIVWWIRAVAGQFMAWEGGRERQRAIALTLHGDVVEKGVRCWFASGFDERLSSGVSRSRKPSNSAATRCGPPDMGANGAAGGAKRSSLTADTRVQTPPHDCAGPTHRKGWPPEWAPLPSL